MNLKIYSDHENDILKQAEERINEIEEELSITNENSDISRINCAEGNIVTVCDDTKIILNEALSMYKESKGALDITIYPILSAWGFTTQNYRIPDEEELEKLLLNTGTDNICISGNSVSIPLNYKIDTGALTKGYTSD